MTENRRRQATRKLSGNPAVRTQQFRDEQLLRQLAAAGQAAVPSRYRHPTEEDWVRIRCEALLVRPACRDCGSPMLAEDNAGKEGEDDQGRTVFSTVLVCSTYMGANEHEAASEEYEELHPLTHGLVEHKLVLG